MGDFKDESAHNLGPLTMQIRRSTVGTGDNYVHDIKLFILYFYHTLTVKSTAPRNGRNGRPWQPKNFSWSCCNNPCDREGVGFQC